MKLRSLHAFIPLVVLSFGLPARALTTESYSYSVGPVAIPDGNPTGYANLETPASSINVITSVTVNLNFTGGYNGDLYAYLRHVTPGGTGFTVLLNRVGSTTLNPFGYSDSGINVTLADGAANGDIHLSNPGVAPITGTWQPDGRNVDPNLSLDTTPRTTQLSSFNNLSALGGWTLFVVDASSGSVSTLNSWGLTINGISSPFYWKGGASGIWNDVTPGLSNWATDATGATAILAAPDPNADVIFSTTSAANRNTTLGADLTIKSLTINDTTAVTIGGANTLTIGGSTGTTGLTVNAGAGLLTVNSNLTLAGTSNTITVNNAAGALINGIVGGSIGLTKAGTGMLTLANAANTYTGQTKISAGVLSVGVMTDGGLASGIGASGSAAANLLFDGGTLQYTGANASSNRGFSITPGQTATFDITQAASNLALSGAVPSTTGGLTKIGLGTLTLSGANAYTGATAINNGTLQVTVDQALGTAAGATTVASGAALKLNNVNYATAEALTINGTGIGGGGALANTGTSSYAGQVTALTNATINAGGGSLTFTGGLVKNGTTLTLTGGGTINVNATGISGGLANSDLIVDSVTVNENAANSYNGATFIRSTAVAGGGILNANVLGALPTGTRSAVTMDDSGLGGSHLNLGANQFIASLTGAASSLVNLNANNLTIGTTSGITTFAGVIGGTGGSLTKDGASTLILNNANAYTGATSVNGGVLQVNANNALGTTAGSTTVAATATLKLNNVNYATAEALTINGAGSGGSGALLNSGTSTYAGQITAATNATINAGGGTLTLTGGLVKNGTTLTLTGGGTINVNTTGISGALANSDLIVDSVTVNENTANSYNGATFIRSTAAAGTGILNANVTDALPTLNGRSAVTMDDSGLGSSQLNLGADQFIASLTGSASSKVNLNANSLTIGTTSGNTSFAGVISGSGGSLTKDGASTLTLSGTNTFSGATNVNGGTLALGATGSLVSTAVNIASGATLNNAGTLGISSTHIDIAGGGTLMANGTQNYSLLTTSGAGAGTWQGNLTNTTQIAPGGVGTYQGSMATVGTLQVTGNFTNSPSGVLTIDVGTIAPTGHDVLVVGGTAHLGGSLFINKVGLAEIPEFVPVNVIAASSYTGNFASFGWNLAGGVIFNPLNGNIQRFSFQSDKPDSTLFGGTKNQTSSWLSLYDDIADPGITNVTWNGTSYTWVAPTTFDSTNPDLLWALSNSLTPGGMNAALMNRLSPEVYVSLSDYAIQATRAHQRTAFDAPAITPSAQPAATGSKDAAPAPAAASPWEVFAATDFFNVNTNNSENNADYGLNSASAMVGARYGVTDRVRIAAYVAGDEGDISGSLINANGSGWSLGLLGEAVLNQAKGTRLTAGVSYGRYTFDGNRGSASATGAGWAPGLVRFSGLDTDAVELSLGIETIAYHTDHFRLLPSAALHYASGSVSAFSETTGAAVGSPIALVVNRINSQSLLAEVSLIGEADVTSKLTLRGQVGLSNEFKDNPRNVSARFALGSRYMTAQAAGLSDDAVFLGFGATYKFTDRISAGLNYRAEFRSGASPYNSVNLGATYGF